MTRIHFATDQDRIQGNYLLATTGVVRRLRGQIFEITERGVNLLDEHQIAYSVLPIPEPTGGSTLQESVRSMEACAKKSAEKGVADSFRVIAITL